jgi:hypothetical protein
MNATTRQQLLTFLREFTEDHPRRTAGACRHCGHYGSDCYGSRAANLLADLEGRERPTGLVTR